MKYSLATNLDERLIPEIAKIDTEKCIKSVYGKLKSDVIGGGRPAMFLPDITMNELANYIKLCHDNQLEFNYLLNAMCLGNRELQKDTRKEIVDFMGEIVDMGVDWFTVNSPYLCKVIKDLFPKVKVSIGVHAGVSELQNLRLWEELKVDEVTLQMYTTRNFGLLESMLNYTKGTNMNLRVFANVLCLHNCSYRISHSTGQSHASRIGEASEKFFLDCNTMTCTSKKVKNPANFMMAEWIRPEDVKYYEELCEKTGNYNMSIKLCERIKSTEFLLRVAKAYIDKSYEGNLLDLMLWPWTKSPLAILDESNTKNKVNKTDIPEGLKVILDFYNMPEIYIDNKKLDGFINKFLTDYDCNKKVCALNGIECNERLANNKLECTYCKQWSEKAVQYDREEVVEWAEKANRILDSITDGSLINSI